MKRNKSTKDLNQIDSIVSKKIQGRKVTYEVKWIGKNETTWETADNLPEELVESYENEMQVESAKDENSMDISSPKTRSKAKTNNIESSVSSFNFPTKSKEKTKNNTSSAK